MDQDQAMDIISNTDLFKVLLSKGISQEYLSDLKRRKFDTYSLDYLYSTYEHEMSVEKLVDVKKIDGIYRVRSNDSIFDIAQKGTDLHYLKMERAFRHIIDDSIETLHLWYKEQCEPVRLEYYADDDIYRVSSDGSHRSLYAIMVNAPFIKARVNIHKKNEEAQIAYDYYLLIKKEYNIIDVGENPRRRGYVQACFISSETEYSVEYDGKIKDGYFYNKELLKIFEKKVSDDLFVINHQFIRKLFELRMPSKISEFLLGFIIEKLIKEQRYANKLRIYDNLKFRYADIQKE